MRCVLVGVPAWCTHLHDELEAVSDLRCEVRAPAEVVRLRSRDADVVVRVGMRPGARTPRGRVFDLIWSRSVPVERRVTYWIGTDVYDTVHDVERVARSIDGLGGLHLAGAPWMTEELRRIGIHATTSIFPTTVGLADPVGFPSRFRVSSYVPELRPDFYGRRVIEELARRLPDVEFEVWGSDRPSPAPNLAYRGRTDDMNAALDRSVVHLRLTRHDAIAGTVREALGRARYVVFPYELDGVITVAPWDVDAAEREIVRLRTDFDRGELRLNELGRAAVAPLVDRALAVQLADRLITVAQSSSR